MTELLTAVVNLVSAAIKDGKSDEQIARELIDAAFASGVPAAFLLDHLTLRSRERAELAADLAQWVKVHGPRS